MSVNKRFPFAKAFLFVSCVLPVALAGCGVGSQQGIAVQSPLSPASKARFKVSGNVHGGAYPIQQATIRLMLTQSNGFGGAALQLDAATSDANGNFSFPNADTCPTAQANQFAYITVSGGHTSSNATNNNVVQVGVIGSCATDLAAAEIQNVEVYLSELSTVAAAYALGNFITIDSTTNPAGGQLVNISAPPGDNAANPGCTGLGIGSGGMTCTAAGLAHGFANAYNLVDSVRYDGSFPTGAARTALPKNPQGMVPQALINTLGNILQSCVDSPGGAAVANRAGTYVSDGTHCGDLFADATPPKGTAPTNTLAAALDIAKNPTNNVDQLFALQPRAVFFTPDLSSDKLSSSATTLMAYTVSIFYTGTGVSGDSGMPFPVDIALDALDNAYVLYSGDGSGTSYTALNGFGANGTGLFAGSHLASLANPTNLAMDSTGYAWVTNDTAAGGISSLNTPITGGTNGAVSLTVPVSNGYASALAIDTSNNLWVARDSSDANQSFFIFNQANGYTSVPFYTCTKYGILGNCRQKAPSSPVLGAPSKRIAVDSSQNLWGVTSSGKATAQTFIFSYGSLGDIATMYSSNLDTNAGFAVAVDGSNHAFFPLNGTLDTASSSTSGVFTAGVAGTYTGTSTTGSTYQVPLGVALDGADSVYWTDFETAGQVFIMTPTASGSVTGGKLVSFFPCYPLNGQCYSGASSYLRSMAIDSSGAMWYVADSTTGAVVQTLGLAAPTWPLLSYAHAGQSLAVTQ